MSARRPSSVPPATGLFQVGERARPPIRESQPAVGRGVGLPIPSKAGDARKSKAGRSRLGRPWEDLGMSRRTYFRRKAEGSIGGVE